MKNKLNSTVRIDGEHHVDVRVGEKGGIRRHAAYLYLGIGDREALRLIVVVNEDQRPGNFKRKFKKFYNYFDELFGDIKRALRRLRAVLIRNHENDRLRLNKVDTFGWNGDKNSKRILARNFKFVRS